MLLGSEKHTQQPSFQEKRVSIAVTSHDMMASKSSGNSTVCLAIIQIMIKENIKASQYYPLVRIKQCGQRSHALHMVDQGDNTMRHDKTFWKRPIEQWFLANRT